MFRSTRTASQRIGMWARAASYLVAALAGAVGVGLARRMRGGQRPMPTLQRDSMPPARGLEEGTTGDSDRVAPQARDHSVPGSTPRFMDAGWAEIVEEGGRLCGRGQVMLAFGGGAPADGEIRSLRFTHGVEALAPGRYWVRFETSQEAHGVQVVAFGVSGADIAAIRWDDPDLPSSLVELGES